MNYEVACKKFGHMAVDELHQQVATCKNRQVVTDGDRILICYSVGTQVPPCYERVHNKDVLA